MKSISCHYKVFRESKRHIEKEPILDKIIIPLINLTEKEFLDKICNSIKEEMKLKRYKMKNKGYDITICGFPINNLKQKIKRRLFKNT